MMHETPRFPLEITITILAGMTVFLTMPPLFLPVWATYIVWGGTFLVFQQRFSLLECIKRTWPPLVLGATAGVSTNILDLWTATKTTGISTFGVEALILGILVLIVVYMERIPIFADGPFIFFSFAACDGILASQAGPAPHTWWLYWFVTVAMSLLGPLLAWASFKLMLPLPSVMVASRSRPHNYKKLYVRRRY